MRITLLPQPRVSSRVRKPIRRSCRAICRKVRVSRDFFTNSTPIIRAQSHAHRPCWDGAFASPPGHPGCTGRLRRHFFKYSLSIKSKVATAAAQASGLPPYVLPCEPRGQVANVCTGYHRSQRDARSNAFCKANNVRLHSKMLDGPPFTGAPNPCLNFVGDQQDNRSDRKVCVKPGKIREVEQCTHLHPGSVSTRMPATSSAGTILPRSCSSI